MSLHARRDLKWFHQQISRQEPQALLEAWDWLLYVKQHPDLFSEEYHSFRWLDHQEREIFEALKDRELWEVARLLARGSIVPEAGQARLASLPS